MIELEPLPEEFSDALDELTLAQKAQLYDILQRELLYVRAVDMCRTCHTLDCGGYCDYDRGD